MVSALILCLAAGLVGVGEIGCGTAAGMAEEALPKREG